MQARVSRTHAKSMNIIENHWTRTKTNDNQRKPTWHRDEKNEKSYTSRREQREKRDIATRRMRQTWHCDEKNENNDTLRRLRREKWEIVTGKMRKARNARKTIHVCFSRICCSLPLSIYWIWQKTGERVGTCFRSRWKFLTNTSKSLYVFSLAMLFSFKNATQSALGFAR